MRPYNIEEEIGSPVEFKQEHLKIFEDDSPEQLEVPKSPARTKSPKNIEAFAESVKMQKEGLRGFKT